MTVGPDDLAPLFPMSLIGQEVTTERYVEIPDPVRDVYRLWRPTPLYRARRLEQALDALAHAHAVIEVSLDGGSKLPVMVNVSSAAPSRKSMLPLLMNEAGPVGDASAAVAARAPMSAAPVSLSSRRVTTPLTMVAT